MLYEIFDKDYWAKIDDPDLFPCGFWKYCKKLSIENFRGISKFDPPYGHIGPFDWMSYFEANDFHPVPFEFFTEVWFSSFNK